jgi:glycosyltransferase involved in cell wall biosynthesis
MTDGLSLFVPVHNEEALVAANMRRLLGEAERLAPRIQLVLVENGSRDRTPDIVDELAAADPRVVALKLPAPGVGTAMRSAIPHFAFSRVLALDADLTIDLSFLAEAADRLSNGADIVIGSKRMGTQQRRLFRVLTSDVFCWLLTRGLGLPFDDVSIGAKGYRREVLQRYLPWIGRDSVYVLDVIARAHADGLRIDQFPIFCHDSRPSQFNLAREGIVRFGHLFARIGGRLVRGLWRRTARRQRPHLSSEAPLEPVKSDGTRSAR